LFVWRGTNDFDAGKLILSAMEGVGPENQEFLGPEISEMAPCKASAISGPKFELNRNP
jgi:hypothetical protein